MRLRKFITKRRLKWVGLLGTVLLLVVYVWSSWFRVAIVFNSPTVRRNIHIGQGQFEGVVVRDDGERRFYKPNGVHRGVWPLSQRQPIQWGFGPGVVSRRVLFAEPQGQWLTVPMWLPLLLIAAPTAWLWRVDRRAKPWQCSKCRYDLRGLDGGVCPECGEVC